MNKSMNKLNAEGCTILALLVFFLAIGFSSNVMAGPVGFEGACNNVVKFFKNFEVLLKAVSVLVVTVAIVFAGYQIAFAHKRLSDVAPVLIGGLLIGGAAAIAGWFTESWAGTGATNCTPVTMISTQIWFG